MQLQQWSPVNQINKVLTGGTEEPSVNVNDKAVLIYIKINLFWPLGVSKGQL